MEAARGVADEELDVLLLGGHIGVVTKGGGIAVILALDHFHADALRPDTELLDGGCAEGIGGGEHHGVAFRFQKVREFCRGSRLAGAIHADHEDHFRLRREGAQCGVVEREDFHHLLACNFVHVVCGDRFFAGLERSKDAHRHWHTEIGADEHLLQFIPVNGLAGEFLDDRFEKSDGHVRALL